MTWHPFGREDYGDPADFPVGSRVEVQPCWEDFRAIRRGTGTVVANDMRYLGIIVEFDQPQVVYETDLPDGLRRFNFHARNLRMLLPGTMAAPDVQESEQEGAA